MATRLYFILSLCLLAALARAGLVPNPGFEEGADGIARTWLVNQTPLTVTPTKGTGNAVIDWAEGSHGDGKRCLRIRGKVTEGNDYAIVVSPQLRVEPGFTYTVSSFYRAAGLAPENGDRTQEADAYIDVFMNDAQGKYVKNVRAITCVNTPEWSPLTTVPFVIPPTVVSVQIRLQVASSVPGRAYEVVFDEVALTPADAGVPNPGFEELDSKGQPVGWHSQGSGKSTVDATVHHTGKNSVAVSDAGDGLMSGWSTVVPAREDRAYRFAGWAKGGNLAANGILPGGALQLVYLDVEDRPLGKAVISPTVGINQDWTELSTPAATTPVGTVRLRLTAGLKYCNGTAWFDDLRLESVEARVSGEKLAQVKRDPKPDPKCHYAANLLANPEVEEGNGGSPAHWTFVGSAARDWSAAAIAAFHREGRPAFDIGRARGEWSRSSVYAGRGALLLESIDPPLSKNSQWYGRNPVDGYWISDPMPCSVGQSYLAAAWICPGVNIVEAWHGPLELRFYDAAGRQIAGSNVRSGMGDSLAGNWTWWVSRPYTAPTGATQMRLRVGQEISADSGGWGRSIYDNLAVWHLDGGGVAGGVGSIPEPPLATGDSALHQAWLRKVLAVCPSPYQPAPAVAAAYESCLVRLENTVPGNCFRDPAAPVKLKLGLTNQLGEARVVSVRAVCMDWKGAAMPAVERSGIALAGFGEATATLDLPATGAYGAYYVDLTVREGEATVCTGSGRFGVLPALDRPRTAKAIWGVTPLMNQLVGDNRPEERELGEMLHLAGFGVSWVGVFFSEFEPDVITAEAAKIRPLLAWYRSLGIRPVLRIGIPPNWRPVVREKYVLAGRAIAKATADLVEAYGNHGVEQANSASPYRGGGAARMTDDEYDTILSGIYEGIKAEAPQATVLVGNIATDWEGKTLTRLYGKPANGAFDGAILNAYMGITMTVVNSVKIFDAHGDTNKGVWQEETAAQCSPIDGEARRYGEGQGAANLVRVWLEPVLKVGNRLKAFTMWGFRARGSSTEDRIAMVNVDLQPRPQFVAHAVMADALADATLVADRSVGQLSCGEWKRGDGTLLVLWSNGGTQAVTLEAPTGALAVMDLVGNRRQIKAKDGVAVIEVTSDPIYCFGGGALRFSKRLELSLGHGSMQADLPQAKLTVRNNQDAEAVIKLAFTGPFTGNIPATLSVAPHAQATVDLALKTNLDSGVRTPMAVTATTSTGAVFGANAALNTAFAVQTNTPVPLTGKWEGPWTTAPVITFGNQPDEVTKPNVVGESYRGPDDIMGKMRLLWDDNYLYLGVEALDDIYMPVPTRTNGFMGDSIEFAIQPDGILSNIAPRYEYEFFRPANDPVPALNRRFPSAGAVTDWKMSVTPTGHRGDVNYQIAIPWSEIGIAKTPGVGRTFTMGLVLNDADTPNFGGGRKHILWFRGVDSKTIEGFGDVVLVKPAAKSLSPAGTFSAYHMGNSLTGDLFTEFRNVATAYQKALGNTYQWRVHYRGATSLKYMFDNPTGPKTASIQGTDADYSWAEVGTAKFMPWTVALPQNHWDVVTMQVWQDDVRATLKADTEAVNAIIAATKTRADNAATRFFIYAPWTVVKFDDLDSYRQAYLAPLSTDSDPVGTATRDYFRHVTAAVRQTNPEVALIPSGEVLLALDDKMRAGKFEHLTSVQQLHRDVIHLNSLGSNVTAWTAYAVIFKKSPVGLPNDIHPDKDYPPFKNVTEVSPADLKLIQETIWEVVNSPELRAYTRLP